MVVGVQLLSPAVNLKNKDEAGFTGLPALFPRKWRWSLPVYPSPQNWITPFNLFPKP